MKVNVNLTKQVDMKTLDVSAGVRYWEDGTINGVDDENGDLVPFRVDDRWKPVIDVDKGQIKDWPMGVTAELHYKVCDDGCYYLKDENDDVVLSIDFDYVPEMMCPKENGYGDYIIMDIDENGFIADWKFTLDGFI